MNKLFFSSAITILLLLSSTSYANSLNLEVRKAGDGDVYVKNVGNCDVFKLHVWTNPPKQDSVVNFLSRAVSMVAGLTVYKKDVGTLSVGDNILIRRSSLTNIEGKKLDQNYIVGSWNFRGVACGEEESVGFKW